VKLLLVDDSSTMRRIQKNVLTKCGYTDVVEAEDGVNALAKMQSGKMDMILLDWNMPNMDGLTFLKTIRERNDGTPVIMVTTEGEKDRVLTALQAGANSYVIKPFTPELLIKRIQEVMEKANAMKVGS
jgi:two-component system, chemotaxis family, chemotaxis protein CheY